MTRVSYVQTCKKNRRLAYTFDFTTLCQLLDSYIQRQLIKHHRHIIKYAFWMVDISSLKIILRIKVTDIIIYIIFCNTRHTLIRVLRYMTMATMTIAISRIRTIGTTTPKMIESLVSVSFD